MGVDKRHQVCWRPEPSEKRVSEKTPTGPWLSLAKWADRLGEREPNLTRYHGLGGGAAARALSPHVRVLSSALAI